MKKGLSTALIAFSFMFTVNAYGADGLYVSGNIGLGMPNDADATGTNALGVTASREFDSGPAFTAALGYGIDNIRFEGEIGYQKNDFNSQEAFGVSRDLNGDLTSLSFLVNAYYDFHNSSKFTPFITTGIGVAKVDVNDLRIPDSTQASFSDDDTVFAGQIGAGVSYAINESFDVDLKYRYFMADNLEFSNGSTLDGPTSHNLYLGLRYTF